MKLIPKPVLTFVGWWKRQSTKKKVVLVGALILVLFVALRSGATDPNTVVETVKQQNLVRSVSASGTVVSSTDLSLGFEQSKMVTSVAATVGKAVKTGDVLATLSNGSERAAVSSARGALLAARARYNKVLEGSSDEEVKLAQVELTNAKRALLSEGLVAKPDDVSGGVLAPTISGSYTGGEGVYIIELNKLAQNRLEYSGLERGSVRVDDSSAHKLGTKGLYVQFPVGSIDLISTGTVWTITIPNVEASSYIANRAAVDQKEAALAITQANARQPDVDAALADVVTAQAGVDTAVAALEKTILRAPANGTITSVDVKVGEIPTIGTQAIALQDVSNLYLEANVNESNIKSVTVGQPVSVTFDAFSGDTFYATVSSIDPAATIENNVVNYKIKALLTNAQDIRPGMTANMTITTARIDNVLVLPARVITTTAEGATVEVIVDERKQKTATRVVKTGLKGDGDLVEIQDGLVEGDRVMWTQK